VEKPGRPAAYAGPSATTPKTKIHNYSRMITETSSVDPGSAAMRLLNARVDTTVIALWMGHENVTTTQIYIHADLALKEKAIAQTAPQDTPPGRYQPPDAVLAFLDGL
jgi:integrase